MTLARFQPKVIVTWQGAGVWAELQWKFRLDTRRNFLILKWWDGWANDRWLLLTLLMMIVGLGRAWPGELCHYTNY